MKYSRLTKKMLIWQVLPALLAAGLLLAACGNKEKEQAKPFECQDTIGCVDIAPDAPIKIGIIQALSGSLQPNGTQYTRSVEIAVDDKGGEILGHKIELQPEDDACTGEAAATVALKLVADPQIIGIIGTTCSGAARSAAPIISEAGMVMISGSNTSPSLTTLGDGQNGEDWNAGYFRTAHNDIYQGHVAATFAFNELGIKKAATIDDGDAYTKALSAVFSQAFTELGGEMVFEGTVNKGDTDMKPILTAVVESGAEFVFFPIFQPEGDFITIQSKEVDGFSDIKLMSADGLLLGAFVDSVGEAGVGVYFIGPNTPQTDAYQAFVDKYNKKYGEPLTTNYHAHTYDAANMLFNAIEAVAVKDQDGTLHIGRQAVRDYLYALTDYQGLSGQLTCNEFGDCGVARFKVVRLDDPSLGIDGLRQNIIYTFPPAN